MRGGTIQARRVVFEQTPRPSVSAPRSCSALPSCWRSRPPAWALPISALSGFPRAWILPAQRRGGRSGAQYRPRTDLLPLAGALFRRHRQGGGRQGGAGGRSQPEGSHHRSMKGTTNPARLDQVTKLEREFRAFTKIFADILKVKEESARIAQNQLTRSGNSLRYKLDDLPSNADDAELQADHARREEGGRAISGDDGARQYVRRQFGQDGRGQRAGAPEIRREFAEGDLVEQRKDSAGHQGSCGAAGRIPAGADQADR